MIDGRRPQLLCPSTRTHTVELVYILRISLHIVSFFNILSPLLTLVSFFSAFTWSVTLMMFCQMLVSTIPVFKYILGFTLKQTLLMLAPALLLHVSVWNALHPAMHYLPGVPVATGPASRYVSLTLYISTYVYTLRSHKQTHV